MSTLLKVHKDSGKGALTEFEKTLSKVLCGIQESASPIAKEVKTLYIHKAVTLPINPTTKCAVVFVPMPFLLRFRKIGTDLIAELEKKSQIINLLLLVIVRSLEQRMLKEENRDLSLIL
eukprot:gnl/Chilomastix_caulleri/1239.p1 GENE.gnl/Chilomastix_caulleri/1239~~gnl/Chilomastix_caulleri/1239.p1  ORF type:complete len:119 (+),score=21.22 gnl/Chilomastix_caulleri/1239:55-411(+)